MIADSIGNGERGIGHGAWGIARQGRQGRFFPMPNALIDPDFVDRLMIGSRKGAFGEAVPEG
ncbi:hypothetical protein ACQFX9_29350 [Aliinostoc sp. HNIBRCY26]|uniref:hypothetical protein n=1 Tax=Aliinostoc sp. HNIBRCY26 TaxID=3418997 RepID=UPI003D01EBF4